MSLVDGVMPEPLGVLEAGLDLQACRICLETQGALIHISGDQILDDLRMLMNCEVSLVDGLPCWICGFCRLSLRQYRRLRVRALQARHSLLAIMQLYPQVNTNIIKCERERLFTPSLSRSNTLVVDISNSERQNYEMHHFLPATPSRDTDINISINNMAISLAQPDLQTETLASLAPSHPDIFTVSPANTKYYCFSYDDCIKSGPVKLVLKMEHREHDEKNEIDNNVNNDRDDHWLDDKYDLVINDEVDGEDKDVVELCKVKMEQLDESDAYEDLPLDVFKRQSDKRKISIKNEKNEERLGKKETKRKKDHLDLGEEQSRSKKAKRVKGDKKRRKEKKMKAEVEVIEEKEIKQEVKEKSKGEFSSRMVLETEQYKVIRLTREEVLEEMLEAANGERYQNAPYKCDLCVKGFNYEDVLQNHMVKHEAKVGDLECDICGQFLPSTVSMRGHKKSHCTKYQCKQCLVVKASRQHLLEHYTLQHEGTPRTYICNVCGKTLTKRTMFQKHMRIHFPSHKIACDKCGKLFKTIETLRAHMLRHADIKRYACDQCPKAFRYASLLYTHKVTHVTTRDYYCVECDLRFKTQSNLRLHLRKSLKHIDPDTLKFACTQCDKRYDDDRSLRHHISWQHLRQKNYTCPYCDMRFGSPDGLRSHRKKIHEGQRPARTHVCEICNHAFRAKAVLIKHIRVHTGERPFECSQCGKKFAQNSTMATHIKLVHLKQARKPRSEK